MTTTITLARLHDLRLSGMAQALTQQQEQHSTYEALPFLERLGLLVEQECLVRDQRKQDRLIRQARFKLRATVQDIDYQHPRNLQPAQIARLAQGDWLQRAQNLLITGPCGSGKTYLACALGHNDRHGSASTVMVSQLPVDQWYVTVGDNTLADALLDRLIHNAHRLALKGESMRKKRVKLTEREHLS